MRTLLIATLSIVTITILTLATYFLFASTNTLGIDDHVATTLNPTDNNLDFMQDVSLEYYLIVIPLTLPVLVIFYHQIWLGKQLFRFNKWEWILSRPINMHESIYSYCSRWIGSFVCVRLSGSHSLTFLLTGFQQSASRFVLPFSSGDNCLLQTLLWSRVGSKVQNRLGSHVFIWLFIYTLIGSLVCCHFWINLKQGAGTWSIANLLSWWIRELDINTFSRHTDQLRIWAVSCPISLLNISFHIVIFNVVGALYCCFVGFTWGVVVILSPLWREKRNESTNILFMF